MSGLVARNWPSLMNVVPIDARELDNFSPSLKLSYDISFFVKEKESNLNITVTNKGGLLNFDTIVKASDLASFLPSLNKVINLLNIIISNQNE